MWRKWLPVLLGLIAAFLPGTAQALDHDRRLTQFHHTAWTLAAGAPPDIWALAQSPDGFLWLGTGAGLFRFDGIRFERFQPAPGDAFPARNIVSLLSLPSGDLWIGYQNGGISRLSRGRLQNFTKGIPPGSIVQLNLGRDGAIWAVGLGNVWGGEIGVWSGGRWHHVGRDWGVPDTEIRGLAIDRKGTVWLAANRRLMRLLPGERRFESTDVMMADRAKLFVGPGDRLWSSDPVYGTRVLPTDGPAPPISPVSYVDASFASRIIFDRQGALWATTEIGGVFRVAPAIAGAATGPLRKAELTDRIGFAQGLSSDIAQPLLEDREGNIWVGTNLGLDRFRASAVVAQSDIPVTSPKGYVAGFDTKGALYVTDSNALRRIGADGVAHVVANGLKGWSALCPGTAGSMWFANQQRLRRTGRFGLEAVSMPPEALRSYVAACQEDAQGRLWISVVDVGLFRRDQQGWTRLTIPGTPAHYSPFQMVADRHGRMWLQYRGRTLIMVEGRQIRRYGLAEGIDIGELAIMSPRDNGILVGGDYGVARFDGRRFQSLRVAPSSPLARITGIAETKRGETWFNGIAGIVRVATRDLDAAFAKRSRTPNWEVFDFQDGVPGVAQQDSSTPTAIAGPDGRVWFVTNHGLAWVDPMALHRNPLPPPVVIRALRANGTDVPISEGLQLAKGTSSLQIDYTALSLAVSERVRFRYRLDGVDDNWIDPGTRRQAFYTNLGPGHHVFRVIAANNDGVWNREGATLAFDIPPTFLQSRWFLALCTGGVGLVLWVAYRIRVRQLTGKMRERLEQRLAERERIARDLHDTLLQGFQGLILRFQSVANEIPRNLRAHGLLGEALDSADKVLSDGRDSVRQLRTVDSTDIAQAMSDTANRMSATYPAEFAMVVEGTPRQLHPIVRGEITRIGEEAIINAFQHGEASLVEVALSYGANDLTLGIRDNGVGIDAAFLDNGGRQGHFGLVGMQERATQIDAGFSVASRPGAGTEINLTVPGRIAYVAQRRSWWRIWQDVPFGSGALQS